MGDKGGGGAGSIWKSHSNGPYLIFVDIPAICCQVLASTPDLRFKCQYIFN